MDSNTHSDQPPQPPEGLRPPEGLGPLVAVLDDLEAENLDRLPATVRAQRALVLRQLADRLDGQWLTELAALDTTGAADADQGEQAASTAAWLRQRLRMGAAAAAEAVRTARALSAAPPPTPPCPPG